MPNKKIKIKVTKKKKKITTKQSGNIIRVNVSNSSPGGVAQRSAPASGGVVYIPQQPASQQPASSDSNMAQILQYLYLERNKDAEQLKSLNPNNVRDAAEARRIAQEASQEAKQLITISNPKMLAPDFSVPAPPPKPSVFAPFKPPRQKFAPTKEELASKLGSLKPVGERFTQIAPASPKINIGATFPESPAGIRRVQSAPASAQETNLEIARRLTEKYKRPTSSEIFGPGPFASGPVPDSGEAQRAAITELRLSQPVQGLAAESASSQSSISSSPGFLAESGKRGIEWDINSMGEIYKLPPKGPGSVASESAASETAASAKSGASRTSQDKALVEGGPQNIIQARTRSQVTAQAAAQPLQPVVEEAK